MTEMTAPEITVRCLTHPAHVSPPLHGEQACRAWEESHRAWSLRQCTFKWVTADEPEPAQAPVPAEPGATARMAVTQADVDGVIVAFKHRLGTPRVLVRAYAGPTPIGYAFANTISDDEVEVSIVDGTTELTAEVLPEEDEEQADG